jgi:hypothetical protein
MGARQDNGAGGPGKKRGCPRRAGFDRLGAPIMLPLSPFTSGDRSHSPRLSLFSPKAYVRKLLQRHRSGDGPIHASPACDACAPARCRESGTRRRECPTNAGQRSYLLPVIFRCLGLGGGAGRGGRNVSASQLVNSSIASALAVNISLSSLLVLRTAFVRSALIFALFRFTHAWRSSSFIIHSPCSFLWLSRPRTPLFRVSRIAE